MAQKVIKLTEDKLHDIIKESVVRVLNEIGDTEKYQKLMGKLHAKYWGQTKDNIRKGEIEKARDLAKKSDEIFNHAFNHFGYPNDGETSDEIERRNKLFMAFQKGNESYKKKF